MLETMGNRRQCQAMFRLTAEQIHNLHDLLSTSFGLTGTAGVSSLEKLGIFLYTMAGNRPCRDANNRWVRSNSTVSISFHQVLTAMNILAGNILKPVDPNFTDYHSVVSENDWFKPFYQSVGAVDGTHVLVVTSSSSSMQHRNRHHVTTKNVLVICDHDGRIIFCDAGWPGSVHDQRILNEAVQNYPYDFPRLLLGRYLLVDSGFPSRMGFLAPYLHVRYHRDQLGNEGAPPPVGREETFNHRHSCLRGIVERTFGIVKKMWQILKEIPYYPDEVVPTRIIHATFALHNFRLDSTDANYRQNNALYNGYPVPPVNDSFDQMYYATNSEQAMNILRDCIADELYYRYP